MNVVVDEKVFHFRCQGKTHTYTRRDEQIVEGIEKPQLLTPGSPP